MDYRVMNTEGYREIMQRYHTGSLTAKVVSSFNYTPEEQASFFHEKERHFSVQVTKLLVEASHVSEFGGNSIQ